MTLSGAVWYYLLVFPRILQLTLLVVMVRWRSYRNFPIFFVYNIVELIVFAVVFAQMNSASTTGMEYTVVYSFGLAASTALRFGIIHEILAHLFRNYALFKRFGRPLFRWVTVGLLLSASLLALQSGGTEFDRMLYVVYLLDRTASFLQCGLLIVLFFTAAYFGLSWRNHVFGIALGLGIFACMELAISAIRTNTGYLYSSYLDFVTMGTYHCCVLIWVVYLWAPERATEYKLKAGTEEQLEVWNKELERMLR